MKPIANALPSIKSPTQSPDSTPVSLTPDSSQAALASSLSSKPLAPAALATLWQRAAEIYGHKWVSSFGAQPSDTWAKGLAGLTGEQVAAGLRACLTSADPWPPSLPQFRAMCMAIPCLGRVRDEISGNAPERTRFGLLVSQFLDWYGWRHADSSKGERMLAEAYGRARQHVLECGELPELPVALIENTEEPRKPADPEVVKEHLEKLRQIMEGGSRGRLESD